MNSTKHIAIQTPYGKTERINTPDIVQQGGVWGPTLCSNHTDKMGKTCEDRKTCFYRYKGLVNILPLTFVNDTGGVAKCGEDAKKLKNFLVTQIESKKLKFNEGNVQRRGKCYKMHVGKDDDSCTKLKVHT